MNRTHTTCRRCGFSVPADAPVCPGCRRPAITDWRRQARQAVAVERQARRLPPPLRSDGYRSLLPWARVARALLSLGALASLVTGALHLALLFGPDERRLDDTTTTATAGLLVLLVGTGAAFVAWAVRAYRNLPSLGIRDRRYWTIWLVLGWVVPGANLLVPKLLVDDIWRASSPSLPVDGDAAWQRRPVASVVNRWWCSFLVTPAVTVLAVVTARGGAERFDDRVLVTTAAAVGAAALVVAAGAARQLVAVVTVAQARRADLIVDVRSDQRRARDHRLAADWALQ